MNNLATLDAFLAHPILANPACKQTREPAHACTAAIVNKKQTLKKRNKGNPRTRDQIQ
jgi:hypothetical protein